MHISVFYRLRRERLATAAAHAPVEPTAPNQTEFVEGEDLIPEIPDLCECASSVSSCRVNENSLLALSCCMVFVFDKH